MRQFETSKVLCAVEWIDEVTYGQNNTKKRDLSW
jgi:hypothetical protein